MVDITVWKRESRDADMLPLLLCVCFWTPQWERSALSPQPTRMEGTFAAGAPILIPYSLVVPVFYHSTANSNADADSISILMRGHGPNFTALATAAMDRNHQNAHQGMKGFKVRYIQNGTWWHNKKTHSIVTALTNRKRFTLNKIHQLQTHKPWPVWSLKEVSTERVGRKGGQGRGNADNKFCLTRRN